MKRLLGRRLALAIGLAGAAVTTMGVSRCGGSGTTTAEVNSLLKEFGQARKMMKSMMGMAGFGGRKGMKGMPMRIPKLPPGMNLPGR